VDNQLTAQQKKAIVRIVQAEVDGMPLTRLLRTPYSCRWCGWVAGRSGQKNPERKQMLRDHEGGCERNGQPWQFIAAQNTYYVKWTNNAAFQEALTQARSRVVQDALQSAATLLQINTAGAVHELARQITGAEKDSDRRLSAIAILDRADVSTAQKAQAGVQVYLPEVDGE
jgi:hypothetical protein